MQMQEGVGVKRRPGRAVASSIQNCLLVEGAQSVSRKLSICSLLHVARLPEGAERWSGQVSWSAFLSRSAIRSHAKVATALILRALESSGPVQKFGASKPHDGFAACRKASLTERGFVRIAGQIERWMKNLREGQNISVVSFSKHVFGQLGQYMA